MIGLPRATGRRPRRCPVAARLDADVAGAVRARPANRIAMIATRDRPSLRIDDPDRPSLDRRPAYGRQSAWLVRARQEQFPAQAANIGRRLWTAGSG